MNYELHLLGDKGSQSLLKWGALKIVKLNLLGSIQQIVTALLEFLSLQMIFSQRFEKDFSVECHFSTLGLQKNQFHTCKTNPPKKLKF